MRPGLTDIAYFVDASPEYREMAMVSLHSLSSVCRSNIDVHMYYMPGTQPDDAERDALAAIAGRCRRLSLSVYTVPERYMPVLSATARLTPLGPMCCGRFLLPFLLEGSEQCLYVDCDTLFLKDPSEGLSGFDHASARNAASAGVRDIVGLLGYRRGYWYVNGGVLLMDLAEWRKTDLAQRCLFESLTGGWRFLDQDAVNFVDRPVSLPFGMNLLGGWFNYDIPIGAFNSMYGTSYKGYGEAIGDASILHYTGETKPGRLESRGPVPGKYEDFVEPYLREREAYARTMETAKERMEANAGDRR